MGLKEDIHGSTPDFTLRSFLSWVWSWTYDQNALTSITTETNSRHYHSSVDGTVARATRTHWQVIDGVLGGKSIQTQLKGKWRTPCHQSSNHVMSESMPTQMLRSCTPRLRINF